MNHPALNPKQAEAIREVAELMLRASDLATAIARNEPAEASRHLAAVELKIKHLSRTVVALDDVNCVHDLHLYL